MSGLLIQNAYRPKTNKAVTPEAVLKEVREAADKETKATGNGHNNSHGVHPSFRGTKRGR